MFTFVIANAWREGRCRVAKRWTRGQK